MYMYFALLLKKIVTFFSRSEPDEPENESKIWLFWYSISRFNFINLEFPVALNGVFNYCFNQ